ncbi:hypothetical protein HW49_06535 [Porphyromonadaceae bacterium COT-184 OH4590]|nr:hypothetical protein HW49_06535 [Porphyromonadaceae bacterium COT-184 OH4590]
MAKTTISQTFLNKKAQLTDLYNFTHQNNQSLEDRIALVVCKQYNKMLNAHNLQTLYQNIFNCIIVD